MKKNKDNMENTPGPNRFSKEELKELIDGLFNYYKQVHIYESDFKNYYRNIKGLTEEEVYEIWTRGYAEDLIYVGVDINPKTNRLELVISRPEDIGEPPPSEIDQAIIEELGLDKPKSKKGSKYNQSNSDPSNEE